MQNSLSSTPDASPLRDKVFLALDLRSGTISGALLEHCTAQSGIEVLGTSSGSTDPFDGAGMRSPGASRFNTQRYLGVVETVVKKLTGMAKQEVRQVCISWVPGHDAQADVQVLTDHLKRLGLEVVLAAPAVQAAFFGVSAPLSAGQACVCLDLGEAESMFGRIEEGRLVQQVSIAAGLGQIRQTLMNEFNASKLEASLAMMWEDAFCPMHSDTGACVDMGDQSLSLHAVLQSMRGALDDLMATVQSNARDAGFELAKSDHLVLTSGMACGAGLADAVGAALDRPVVLGALVPAQISGAMKLSLPWAAALGLGIMSLDKTSDI